MQAVPILKRTNSYTQIDAIWCLTSSYKDNRSRSSLELRYETEEYVMCSSSGAKYVRLPPQEENVVKHMRDAHIAHSKDMSKRRDACHGILTNVKTRLKNMADDITTIREESKIIEEKIIASQKCLDSYARNQDFNGKAVDSNAKILAELASRGARQALSLSAFGSAT